MCRGHLLQLFEAIQQLLHLKKLFSLLEVACFYIFHVMSFALYESDSVLSLKLIWFCYQMRLEESFLSIVMQTLRFFVDVVIQLP